MCAKSLVFGIPITPEPFSNTLYTNTCTCTRIAEQVMERYGDYWLFKCVTLCIHSTHGIGAFNTLFSLLLSVLAITHPKT